MSSSQARDGVITWLERGQLDEQREVLALNFLHAAQFLAVIYRLNPQQYRDLLNYAWSAMVFATPDVPTDVPTDDGEPEEEVPLGQIVISTDDGEYEAQALTPWIECFRAFFFVEFGTTMH